MFFGEKNIFSLPFYIWILELEYLNFCLKNVQDEEMQEMNGAGSFPLEAPGETKGSCDRTPGERSILARFLNVCGKGMPHDQPIRETLLEAKGSKRKVNLNGDQ
ncbi:hypothetical protein TNCT_227651 [Trichonephila clavata]|uniref:Uncharacterized protein n=1 Tax=Trichonephila clavata TaxID=2740835 RepID=A0A8X6HFJ2_TRICU|nr:hypothetical protein TNCT_227651 [Trichonephila clavata]